MDCPYQLCDGKGWLVVRDGVGDFDAHEEPCECEIDRATACVPAFLESLAEQTKEPSQGSTRESHSGGLVASPRVPQSELAARAIWDIEHPEAAKQRDTLDTWPGAVL